MTPTRRLLIAMSAGIGALLLAWTFWGYGAVGPVWLLQALPGCG